MLQDFLASDTADEAEEATVSLYNQEDEEAALLEEVRALAGAPAGASSERCMLVKVMHSAFVRYRSCLVASLIALLVGTRCCSSHAAICVAGLTGAGQEDI
jgi:hypothetical protein